MPSEKRFEFALSKKTLVFLLGRHYINKLLPKWNTIHYALMHLHAQQQSIMNVVSSQMGLQVCMAGAWRPPSGRGLCRKLVGIPPRESDGSRLCVEEAGLMQKYTSTSGKNDTNTNMKCYENI